jgi:dTDP-4-dehydrorhamnose 3,5-epimerase
MRDEFGCLLFDVEKYYPDGRGYFTEFYQYDQPNLENLGFPIIVQTNLSMSAKNTIRGMHFNTKKPQAKMIRVVHGEIIDVVIDLRFRSPNYGLVELYRLNTPSKCLLVPAGCAHGFWSLSDDTILLYGCSEFYNPQHDSGISLLDTRFNFPWQGVFNKTYTTSDQDLNWSSLDLEKPVFTYEPGNRFGCLTNI